MSNNDKFTVELGDSGETQWQFDSIWRTFDSIQFTGALLIWYITHRPLIVYGFYENNKCDT